MKCIYRYIFIIYINFFFEKIKKENDVLNKCLEKNNDFYEKTKNYMNDVMNHIEQKKVKYITFNAFRPNSDRNGYEYVSDYSFNLVLKFGTTIDDMLKIYFIFIIIN